MFPKNGKFAPIRKHLIEMYDDLKIQRKYQSSSFLWQKIV